MADGTPNPDDMMPDEAGNPQGEDSPLGDIDPMEWLESLAARQGATEGFTTQHDLDIAEIDPGSVTLDEPGYTPSESFSARPAEEPAQPEPPPAAEFDFDQPPPAEPELPPAEPEPMAAEQGDMEMPDDVDPMEWLETLAARQGATEGFTTQHDLDIAEIDPDSVALDEPGYTPYETFGQDTSKVQAVEETPPPEEAPVGELPPAEPEPMAAEHGDIAASPDSMEMPDDVDPMEWLETLAARQGATEGFTTQHDLDIAEIDPDSVTLDEPGYTPSESFPARPAEEPAQSEPPPAAEFDFDQPPAEPEPMAAAFEETGFDAETEDFLATLSEELEPVPNLEAAEFDAPTSPEDLSWLDGLGSEPTDAAPEPEAIPPTHTPDEIMASIEGHTDEQLAEMQANGQLSGEQEFAWLQRQALTRIEEKDEQRVPDEDLPPAEAGEIPDWLHQSAVVSEDVSAPATFVDEMAIPPTPEDVPDWLRDEAPQPDGGATSDMELPDFTLESTDAPSPILEADAPDPLDDTSPTAAAISDLKLDAYDPSQDEWAEALDEEHERMEAGLEEDPSWFRSAMDEAEAAQGPMTTPEPAPAPVAPEPEEAPTPDPEWLGEVTEEAPPPPVDEIPEDLPDWLRPVAGATTTDEDDEFGDIGTWLREEESGGSRTGFATQSTETPSADAMPVDALPPASTENLAQAHPGPVPTWAKESAPAAPSPSPEPAQPAPPRPAAPPPTPTPVAAAPPVPQPTRQRIVAEDEPAPPPAHEPAPVPETFEAYKSRLESDPDDHEARIELARELAKSGQVEESLPQYQTLVERKDDLNDVAEDLHSLIVSTPGHPALRRMLGDVYMRQGYLQEALDAYRGALDNL